MTIPHVSCYNPCLFLFPKHSPILPPHHNANKLRLCARSAVRNWGREELNFFLFRHQSWSEEKKAFAQTFFPDTARAIGKWIDDCGLFIFGYLVREFWQEIIRLHLERGTPLEDEVWVASIFHLSINALTPRTVEV
jgi:hypothetical protein